MREQIIRYVRHLQDTLAMLPSNRDVERTVEVLLEAYHKGAKVMAFGNGGSGCLAAHFIQDLAKHTIVGDSKSEVVVEKRFKALCLNETISTMTTWANDLDWKAVFSQQVLNWIEPDDVVVGVTGSGNTENVLLAFEVAKRAGATTIALCGGGKAAEIADVVVVLESDVNYIREDAMSAVVHIVCDALRSTIQGSEQWT